ncbi:hypothetical protein VOLCADRAFT_97755 [Volvox carteri f. nagariensis]|uniref:Uncharacterized protein n=1 Tax=Volvox carteri f. nagariensis TaxID=3068 RepID=D8UDJ9_VOLCA|nr:uncharacterized protein VOLCADRAFT_97755 [Volvox carteri f. nagariensis]EFJ42206.1 hypothetical protein VOLCADRAFT_97755 [Volvox carteri f. nagariensis]|eukprot:XP_002956749.1 hypothetical protein VOLCADRAFT_97755 [Volvox carteri f. nagariensis]
MMWLCNFLLLLCLSIGRLVLAAQQRDGSSTGSVCGGNVEQPTWLPTALEINDPNNGDELRLHLKQWVELSSVADLLAAAAAPLVDGGEGHLYSHANELISLIHVSYP